MDRWTAQGQVTYLLVTPGEAGIAGMQPDRTGRLRVEEERRSAAIVGVTHLEFLYHHNGAVEHGNDLRRDIVRAIRWTRPDVVLTMNFELTWGEEGGVNHARPSGSRPRHTRRLPRRRQRVVVPRDRSRLARGPGVFVFGMASPTHFVDVTGTIDLGVESLSEHKDYIEGLGTDFDPEHFLRDIAGYGGLVAGCGGSSRLGSGGTPSSSSVASPTTACTTASPWSRSWAKMPSAGGSTASPGLLRTG